MERGAFEKDFLGKGMAVPPTRRGGADYTAARGAQLVSMGIRQILNTDKGELPWNPNFGTTIRRQKNKLLNEDFQNLVVAELSQALREFEPRISVLNISIQVQGTKATVRVEWQIIERNVEGNQVLVGPDSVEVSI
jgi:uncharacterized protein